MPRQDGTGPLGKGPLTGKGLGPCGAGMRRGLGYRRQVVLNKDEERKILEAELKEIKAEREEIEKRLKDLK